MKRSILKLLIESLRSGRYKQITIPHHIGYLHDVTSSGGETFCPLGVLCDLHRIMTGGKWIAGSYLGCFASLPEPVMEWAHIDDPVCNLPDPHSSLVHLNDRLKLTFNQIADILETYV